MKSNKILKLKQTLTILTAIPKMIKIRTKTKKDKVERKINVLNLIKNKSMSQSTILLTA